MMNRQSIHDKIYGYGVPMLLFAVPFNFTAANLIILILAANWLIELDFKNKFRRALQSPYILCCLLLFAFICVDLFFTVNHKAGTFAIEKKLSLLCFPLVIGTTSFFHKQDIRDRCYRFFYSGTLCAAVVLILMALYHYLVTKHPSHFFYHPLVTPFKQHAVYFSVYIYISLVYLYHRYYLSGQLRRFHIVSALFLTGFMILLSSKLIIVLFFLHAAIVFTKHAVRAGRKLFLYGGLSLLIVGLSVLFLTQNPVKQRFNDLRQGNMELLSKSSFTPSDYFNAWQLRLLLWKFSTEILSEKHCWLTGVTPGDAQDLLNEKIKQHNMYTGEPARGDYGYLHHNCHNQYVETLYQTGITGLVLLLWIMLISLTRAIRDKDRTGLFCVLIFCYFFLTESPLERMMGIVPLFIFLSLINLRRVNHASDF